MYALQTRFRPANNADEATHRFSTDEIKRAITELNPGANISEAQVFELMKEHGYTYDAIPGSQLLMFKWLLVEK